MDRKECYILTHPCRKFLATPLKGGEEGREGRAREGEKKAEAAFS